MVLYLFILKKSTYKWTPVVQTRVVQMRQYKKREKKNHENIFI